MSDRVAPADRQTASPTDPHALSCAVLVMSSDAYRDLWTPFFTLFWQYWPDCPFPVYLGTNQAIYQDARVTTLPAGDFEWSDRLRLCLERMDVDYVLLLLEDFFLDGPVSTAKILEYLTFLHTINGAMLRLFPRFGPDLRLEEHRDIGRISTGAPYRVSTQPAIWNRVQLLRLIVGDESIWDFESRGTVRSEALGDCFYGTRGKVLPYRHVVERGQWFWAAARYFKKRQIGCDFKARSVIPPSTALKKSLNRWRKNVMHAILPLRFRRHI